MKNKFHNGLMIYTAAMVPLIGFLWATLSAIGIFILLIMLKLVDNPVNKKREHNMDETLG